jgi:hypothetical protein
MIAKFRARDDSHAVPSRRPDDDARSPGDRSVLADNSGAGRWSWHSKRSRLMAKTGGHPPALAAAKVAAQGLAIRQARGRDRSAAESFVTGDGLATRS